MRVAWIILLVMGLAGCVTTPVGEPTHSQTSAKLRTELAAAYYERAQYGVALDELRKALLADSSFAPAYDVRALVHMALNEDKEAENDFLTSLRFDKMNSEAHNNYGWFLCQRGREEESVKQFLAALKNPLYSTPEKAFLNAGICSGKVGEKKEAMDFLKKALLLRPDMPEALLEMSELEFASGDYAAAKSLYNRYAQGVADNMTAANLWLGVRIERKLGDSNAEQSFALQLRKHFPDSRETQLMLHEQ
jgi:type IV pilus assembly protein PilF